MKASDIPDRFSIPFADSAGSDFIRPIPVDSQIGIDDGAASLETGFPPDTFDPVAAGGIPPNGKDFNGILNQTTAWSRWQGAGGPVPWDSAFSALIGGYPAGASVAADTLGYFWISTVDDNVTDPDAGGAGWVSYSFIGQASRVVTASTNFTLSVSDCFVGLRRVTALSATAIAIPSATRVGQEYTIEDLVGNFSQYPITLTPPTGTIAGHATWTLNEDFDSATVRRYDGDIWSIRR